MTDTEQTFLKQRFEDEAQVDRNYENQSGVRGEFFDIHSNNLNAVGRLESCLEFTGTNEPEEQRTEVTVVEQLRKRIRELESVTLQQNKEIRSNEALERNYEAALRKLLKRETEVSLLTEDREKYFNENQFYKLQAQEISKQCEKQEDRIRNMKISLIDKDRTIRELERQVTLLKENSRHAAEERLPSNVRKPEVSTSLPETGTDQNGSHAKKRRREFRKSLTSLPHCKHCQTVFDVLKPHQVVCTFHRAYPQPLKVWKSQFDLHGNKPQSSFMGSYRFWPCCEKYGIKEPQGCLTLKSHELVYPDEE